MVEFDPAVHAAPSLVIEYDATPNMAYRVYATPVIVVEYHAPAPTVAYQVHAALVPAVKYDNAPAVRATTSALVDGASRQVRACSSGTGHGEDSRFPSCRLSTKSSIFQKSRLSKAPSLETAPVLEIAPAE